MHGTHASDAFLPVIVRPPWNCTTAAPRPIVAIVPLSLYTNGFAFFPGLPRDVGSGVLSGLEGHRTQFGSTSLVSVSVIQAMSPMANTSDARPR